MATAHNPADFTGFRIGDNHSGLNTFVREVGIIVEHFFHTSLNGRIHSGVNNIAAGIESHCIVLQFQSNQRFFDDMVNIGLVRSFSFVCFCSDTYFRQLDFGCFVLLCFIFCDKFTLCHLIQNQIPAFQRIFREPDWRPSGRILDTACQHGCFWNGQLAGVFREEIFSCCFNPVCTAAKVGTVQIMRNDFVFTVLFFYFHCQNCFF